jgi:putative mRNA 3-end processing factor
MGKGPTVVYDHGVHLLGTILWFDPTRLRDFCGITSARVAHLDRRTKTLWSDRTARLVAHRQTGKTKGLACPYGRPFNLGPLRISLFPSGYMAGAAQFEVITETGHQLVYSGPVSVKPNRTSEPIEYRQCDTLILDATYGHERYRFPKREDVYETVLNWVSHALANGDTPVFLVANPGKAQDLVHLLGHSGCHLRVHRSIYEFNKAYLGIGVDLPNCKQFRGTPRHNEIVLWPSHLRRSPAIRNIRRVQFAAMTGMGEQPGIAKRLKVSTVFTWSAQSDYDDLFYYLKRVKPKRVLTVGRHAIDFADVLRTQGFTADCLLPTPQMPLNLGDQ